jgi:hypothetical protein
MRNVAPIQHQEGLGEGRLPAGRSAEASADHLRSLELKRDTTQTATALSRITFDR